MPNPLFDAIGGNNQNNAMMKRFGQFMQQMRGQNPQQILSDMVQSGKISQAQLNQAQQQAQQMSGFFDSLRGGFGF